MTDFDSFAFRTPKDAIEFHFNREADKLWGEEDLSNWRRMIYERSSSDHA